MTDCILVYITTPERHEAELIGRTLVEEKLAACANILPGMSSIYRWHGVVEDGQETVLIVKTRAAFFEPLAERVKGLHANACPCIVAIPLVAGDTSYLDWIRQATAVH